MAASLAPELGQLPFLVPTMVSVTIVAAKLAASRPVTGAELRAAA